MPRFNEPERLHGLDAARGIALLLGIVYHATLSFLPGPSSLLVMDTHRSLTLAAFYYVTHMFRMTTFFLLAGFFARMVIERRGVTAFVKDRAIRILTPLVASWPILNASVLAASAYGAYVATGQAPKTWGPFVYSLMHLWFLYYLLLFYTVALALRGAVMKLDRDGRFRAGVHSLVADIVQCPAAALFLAMPVVLTLVVAGYGKGHWLGWFGLPTPSSLIPGARVSLAYFSAFGFGWLLNGQTRLLGILSRRWPLNLALAVTLTVACLSMVGVAPVAAPAMSHLQHLAYATAYSLAIWAWTLALIGMALRFLSNHSPARRYVADASYWLYLIHFPLVIALQALVSKLDWPWEMKMLAILGVAFPLMFASYQLWVRHGFIGQILTGRRAPAPVGHFQRPEPKPQPNS